MPADPGSASSERVANGEATSVPGPLLAGWLEPARHAWAFSHFEEVVNTALIRRGTGPVRPLPAEPHKGLDSMALGVPGSPALSVAEFLARTSTDAVVVLSGGKLVFERYFGEAAPDRRHVLMSISKSIGAVAAGCVAADGMLDLAAPVASYVPELRDTAYGSATVSQLLDMTASVCYSQDYLDPASEVQTQDRAAGWRDRRPGDPADSREFLATLAPDGLHGEVFWYCSATTDALSWVVERASSTPYAELVSQRVWSRIGAAHPAAISVDQSGNPYACAGIAATAQDLARFGLGVLEAIHAEPGKHAWPHAFFQDTRRGGSLAAIAGHDFSALHPAGSYRNQWWVPGDDSGSLLGIGIFGQYLWLDPVRDVVIVKLSSQAGPLDDRGLHDAAMAAIARLAADRP
jgi:6-aminohexanoate-oligomer exohydrolase